MPAEWIEALHIISVVCWFAALFYLPRLFVYHALAEDEISIERFKVMERQPWFLIKVTLVVLLVVYHHVCLYLMRQFRNDNNTRSHVFYRWFNEIPVLFLIAIVVLVVVRPF